MSLRLHDFIDTHYDFIAPESMDHILGRYMGARDIADPMDPKVSKWDMTENDRMVRCNLDPNQNPMFAGILRTLQESAFNLIRDYYHDHSNVLSTNGFNPQYMRYIDSLNISLNHLFSKKTWFRASCSADHPALFHHQLTGRIVLHNPERRRMNFFYDPNMVSFELPEGSLIIHPSNMLYPHIPDTREGELIYLEFNLCPQLTPNASSELTTH